MSMSCCMCEPMETVQSLGDDTHRVIAQATRALEHGPRTDVWSLMSVGGKPGPSIGAQTRTRAKMNVRHRHLVRNDRLTRRIEQMHIHRHHSVCHRCMFLCALRLVETHKP